MSNRKVPINYTSRDFNSIKNDLIEYAKRYYPENYKDFNEASFGSLMTDIVAYTGDILSFYTDYSVNEAFIDSSLEYNNVIRHGRPLGYRFRGSPSSYGVGTLYIVVPAKTSGYGPDPSYIPLLQKGSQFSTDGGKNFLLNENVNFADSNNEIVVANVDASTGIPSSYAIRAYGQIISGEYYSQTIPVGNYERFLRVKLGGDYISEVISVFDSEGNEYFEVDYLSQDVVFKQIANRNSDKDSVPFILKPVVVPRRFVVEQDINSTYLQFGYGSEEEVKITNVADASNVVLQMPGKDYISSDSFDPTRLLSTDKFGVAPSNTTLTIVTRNNSSANVNVAAGGLSKPVEPIFDFNDIVSLNPTAVSTVMESLEITNDAPIVGSVSVQSVDEIKRRIFDQFASQERAVSVQDYCAVCYALPPRFGAVKRINVVQDSDSLKRNLNLYVVSEDQSGILTETNDTIKQNLKTWLSRYKMVNDSIKILDAKIVNLGFTFEILADESKNKYSVLQTAVTYLQNYFPYPGDIGESFSISSIYSALRNVDGILDVANVKVILKKGGSYSQTSINLNDFISDDGRSVFCPSNVIFEIRFPKNDIYGTVR
jgi:hypothetical protein